MYAARLAAGTAVAAALLVPFAPAASAADRPVPNVHATPGEVQPGQTIQLTLTCPTEAAVVAAGTSQAGTILFGVATSGVFTGTLQVSASTPAGSYTVNASCSAGPPAGKPVVASTTVVVAGHKVTGPVSTGLGGAAGGPDTTQVVLGSALAAGALGVGTVMLRRRSRA